MSDYISKSALIEQIKLYENELSEDRELGVDSDDEMMLFAIANQKTAIYRIKRCIQHEQPTLDETEMIRKVFEKVVERLEEKLSDTNFEKATQECNESYVDGLSMGYAGAIGICKEEGGIE